MHQHGYIGRKMRIPRLKSDPAIIIAAFGSTNRAKTALNLFKQQLKEAYPDQPVYWAYTSEIIRKKLDLPSLHQTLAQVESDGYRKAVVQPLHIFPGTEYQHLAEICEYFPGMRIFLSETLFHRWDFINQIMEAIKPDLLKPEDGLNILAVHGTPLASDPVNIVYMGLERMIENLLSNTFTATVEGVPSFQALLSRLARMDLTKTKKRLRIIPMMYFAGLHTEEDLMGDEDSWRLALEQIGFTVECPTVTIDGKLLYKGLAYYPQVRNGFLNRLARTIELARYY